MDIVWKIVIGGVIGWIASLVMKTNRQMGLLANIVVGILGSILGHYLAPHLGIYPTTTLAIWLVSIGGAVLLILILKVLRILR